VPKGQDIHVVLDNLSAHKAPPVADWLAHPRRARWHLHFTPTSSSWLNLVEGWFSLLTKRRLRRGVFSSVDQLIEAIETWAEHWNDDPKPFVWTKTTDAILAKAREHEQPSTLRLPPATHHECPVARPIIYSSPTMVIRRPERAAGCRPS
jgi:transposase